MRTEEKEAKKEKGKKEKKGREKKGEEKGTMKKIMGRKKYGGENPPTGRNLGGLSPLNAKSNYDPCYIYPLAGLKVSNSGTKSSKTC